MGHTHASIARSSDDPEEFFFSFLLGCLPEVEHGAYAEIGDCAEPSGDVDGNAIDWAQLQADVTVEDGQHWWQVDRLIELNGIWAGVLAIAPNIDVVALAIRVGSRDLPANDANSQAGSIADCQDLVE